MSCHSYDAHVCLIAQMLKSADAHHRKYLSFQCNHAHALWGGTNDALAGDRRIMFVPFNQSPNQSINQPYKVESSSQPRERFFKLSFLCKLFELSVCPSTTWSQTVHLPICGNRKRIFFIGQTKNDGVILKWLFPCTLN